MDRLKKSYSDMAGAFPGGWSAMAAALNLATVHCLKNRAYELKGQHMSVHLAMLMQTAASSTAFAEAVAAESGGVFLRLPEGEVTGHEDLLAKFNALYAELGTLSATFTAATEDGEIDRHERAALERIGQRLHTVLAELLALSFKVYCAPDRQP
jgi:hypothetical protein